MRPRIIICCTSITFLLIFSLFADTNANGLKYSRKDARGERYSAEAKVAYSQVTDSFSIIVCAVDGAVYTLDAFSGDLKSHFSSGTPLVGATGAEDWDEQVVPGLDGRLYALQESRLEPLPITVMDVLANPIKTCRKGDRDCGIVTATKTASLYAFDPSTGSLQWRNGANEKEKDKRDSDGTMDSVILQRDDYVVTHTSVDTGGELWNVSLGHYQALNFHGPFSANKNLEVDSTRKRLTGRQERVTFRGEEGEEKEDYERDAPLISFGEDGRSVVAIDESSGNVLWQRHLQTVVVSVYGVGDEGWVPLRVLDEGEFERYARTLMIEGSPTAALPSGGRSTGALVPAFNEREKSDNYLKLTLYDYISKYFMPTRETLADRDNAALVLYEPPNVKDFLAWKARLSKHESTVFVQSSSSPSSSCTLSEDGFCETNSIHGIEHEAVYRFGPGDLLPKYLPAPDESWTIDMIESSPSTSARGGLFLSWSAVAGIVLLLLSSAATARFYYLRQKRKWTLNHSTPPLLPTNPNSTEDNVLNLSKHTMNFSLSGAEGSDSLHMHSVHATDHLNPLSSSPSSQNRKILITRSTSLPSFKDVKKENAPGRMVKSTNNNGVVAGPIQKTTNSGTTKTGAVTSRSTHALPPAVSFATSPEEAPFGNIDGIPLVRYSRYRSEFNELSPLGKGGFGTVFRCENALDGREYAIKKVFIRSDGNLTKEFSYRLQRVLREVKILALLDHPNIVRYYTAWLELEENGSADDIPNSECTTTTDKNMRRCFSSELLAVGASTADSRNWLSPSHRRAGRISQQGNVSYSEHAGSTSLKPRTAANNPLGRNNLFPSFQDDNSSIDSPFHRRRTIGEDEDIGITFEPSSSGLTLDKITESKTETIGLPVIDDYECSNDGSSSSNSGTVEDGVDNSAAAWSISDEDNPQTSHTPTQQVKARFSHSRIDYDASVENRRRRSQVRHILYIQMQLCSQNTLHDFLANPDLRKADNRAVGGTSVDIPYALTLFNQIARGVKEIHRQGLIHRDLKPSNCFIDDSGVVKVGDFGLSRESAAGIEKGENGGEIESEPAFRDFEKEDDNTAGVGTRSYASPEQMNGSDYDNSTDVFSLGVMLFEMCYPMYTVCERQIVFEGIRQRRVFPELWQSTVARAFPSLHNLLIAMLSQNPSDRPPADTVANRIQVLLGEYTVISLDRNRQLMDDSVLLRVEAAAEDGVLPRTLKLIKDTAPEVSIVQYGLRGQDSKAIMEFALSTSSEVDVNGNEACENDAQRSMQLIIDMMEKSDDIILARQVSHCR